MKNALSTKTQRELTEFLLLTIEKFTALTRQHATEATQPEHVDLLNNLSLHISPDSSYLSLEHEVVDYGLTVRKSPACIQVIVKV